MAILDPIKPTILATRLIPNVDRSLAAKLGLREDQRSLALVTCDIDDSLYTALDEATKMAEVEVVYARSFYAGSAHASGPLSGEVIGILAGPSPAEARAGLSACVDYAREQAWFYCADEAGDLAFFGRGAVATHAGIVVSRHRFVHAPSTGGTVRLDHLTAAYWTNNFRQFRRI